MATINLKRLDDNQSRQILIAGGIGKQVTPVLSGNTWANQITGIQNIDGYRLSALHSQSRWNSVFLYPWLAVTTDNDNKVNAARITFWQCIKNLFSWNPEGNQDLIATYRHTSGKEYSVLIKDVNFDAMNKMEWEYQNIKSTKEALQYAKDEVKHITDRIAYLQSNLAAAKKQSEKLDGKTRAVVKNTTYYQGKCADIQAQITSKENYIKEWEVKLKTAQEKVEAIARDAGENASGKTTGASAVEAPVAILQAVECCIS